MIDSNFPSRTALRGRRALIVEDEPSIAFDLATAIEGVGGIVAGPAMSVQQALILIEEGRVDAAILDVNLPDGDIRPVISALADEGILLLVHTGGGLSPQLREQYPSLRVFTKPTPPPILARFIASRFSSGQEGRSRRL
jgi:CheY-like chemotaxis protein